MRYFYTFLFLLCGLSGLAQGITGRVTAADGQPLEGASLSLSLSLQNGTVPVMNALAGNDGRFSLPGINGPGTLRISYIGYRDTLIRLKPPLGEVLVVLSLSGNLREVLVSTGYQELPRERATGSFTVVSKELLERSVGVSLLDRLRDVTPGLAFLPGSNTSFRVRGQSTLFSNADPLIVLDGFPYNEPVTNINPNDIESVSVLKDAAAASIWGSRAGNGVVVITTKRGRLNRPAEVSFNSSVQVAGRPDLWYGGRMSTADYIGIEKRLFAEGFFSATEASSLHLPLSPVVELLIAQRDGKQSAASVSAQLDALSAFDSRDEVSRYLYRNSVNQQYSVNLSGGSVNQRYFYSAGYDHNLDNSVGNGFDRLTLNGNNSWSFFDKRLEFALGINLSEANTDRNSPGTVTWNRGAQLYPYGLVSGALVHDYRVGFLVGAQQAGLLDWQYRPLDELALSDNTSRLSAQRVNTAVSYRLPLGFAVKLVYQYDHGLTASRNVQDAGSYGVRNLVNRYTQVSGTALSRPVPLGSILDMSNSTAVNHDGRFQLSYDRSFGRHEFSGIAGYEVQTLHVLSDGNRFYGYDSEHATSKPVDGVGLYSFYDNPASGASVPLNNAETDATDHYLSYYANGAYTYDGRLTLSGSTRLDRSNLFGVAANQKGVPLWSLGGAWKVREGLKLRATYGYNGNINKNLSALTTANYFDGSGQGTLLPYAAIINPPNASLRWEKVRQVNFGLDYVYGRFSGSLEYYWKGGLDLIGSTAYAPSTGITVFTGNTAETRGHGLDLSVSAHVSKFWQVDYYLSYVTDKVTAYQQQSTTSSYVQSGAFGAYALLGHPLSSVYSYAWAGLDPATGDPRGYLNGVLSKDYNGIMAGTAPQDLVDNGPARPVVTGALRNTFLYRGWSLSANISYALGYYFRKNSVRYGNQYGLSQQSADYALRWQKAGDEVATNVPSIPLTPNTARDDFYTYSSALVQKADNIRLADVRLSYKFHKVEVYAYAANIGILWRANTFGLDPDFPTNYPNPRSIAGGLRLTY